MDNQGKIYKNSNTETILIYVPARKGFCSFCNKKELQEGEFKVILNRDSTKGFMDDRWFCEDCFKRTKEIFDNLYNEHFNENLIKVNEIPYNFISTKNICSKKEIKIPIKNISPNELQEYRKNNPEKTFLLSDKECIRFINNDCPQQKVKQKIGIGCLVKITKKTRELILQKYPKDTINNKSIDTIYRIGIISESYIRILSIEQDEIVSDYLEWDNSNRYLGKEIWVNGKIEETLEVVG